MAVLAVRCVRTLARNRILSARCAIVVPHAFGQAQLVASLLEFLRTYPDVSVEWILHDRHPNFIADGIDCAIHLGTVEDSAMVALQWRTYRRSLSRRRPC
jgi:DNA-binding transcriptional LysR family regulator